MLVLVGAWLDTSYRRLPNWLALMLLFYGLAHCMFAGDFYGLISGFGHALIALIVGMVLFRFGLIGGGDAKFYAGAAAYFVLPDGLRLLLAVSLAGLALVLVWFVLRRAMGKKVSKVDDDHSKFPYGIAIAAGVIALAFAPLYGSSAGA